MICSFLSLINEDILNKLLFQIDWPLILGGLVFHCYHSLLLRPQHATGLSVFLGFLLAICIFFYKNMSRCRNSFKCSSKCCNLFVTDLFEKCEINVLWHRQFMRSSERIKIVRKMVLGSCFYFIIFVCLNNLSCQQYLSVWHD